MSYAPIVLFCYNRLEHLKLAISHLIANKECEECNLYIFSDGPKTDRDKIEVDKVRDFIRSIKGFKSIEIHYQELNIGIAKSQIDGISRVLEKHESVVVLEDDLKVSPHFLKYLNSGLNHYQDTSNVFVINAYSRAEMHRHLDSDTYFSFRSYSWGWATWRDRWHKATWDLDFFRSAMNSEANEVWFSRGGEDLPVMLKAQVYGQLDSWSIRWSYNIHHQKGICLTPKYSHVSPIHDSSGTHVKSRRKDLENDLTLARANSNYPEQTDVDLQIAKGFSQLYGGIPESLLTRDELYILIRQLQKKLGVFYKLSRFLRFSPSVRKSRISGWIKNKFM